MNVVSINFGFENCDYVEVPIEFVYSFHIGDITKSRSFYPHNQGLQDYTVAGNLCVQFQEEFDNFTGKSQFDTDLARDRLTKYNDICWFGVKYENGTEDIYQVKWLGTDPYSNSGQSSTSYGRGWLYW